MNFKILIVFIFQILSISLKAQSDKFDTHFLHQASINHDSFEEQIKKEIGTNKEIDILISYSKKLSENNLDSAIVCGQLALNKAKRIEYQKGIIEAYKNLSTIFLTANNFIKALEYAEEALKFVTSHNMDFHVGEIKIFIAVIYAETGNFTLSTRYNFESLEIFEKINNKEQIEIVLGNLGADYLAQQNYEKAIDYLFKALDIATEIRDTIGLAYHYNNIGSVYFKHFKDYDTAYIYFKKALEINRLQNNKYLQGINLANIGSFFQRTNNYDSALVYFEKALDIYSRLKSPQMLARTYLLLGELYYDIEAYEKACQNLLLSFEIGKIKNYFETYYKSSNLLEQSYLNLGDTSNAYFYSVQKNWAKDTLSSLQNNTEIAKIEFQYNLEKELQVKKLLQKRKNLYIVIAFTLLVIVILVTIVLFYKQRIKTNKIYFEKSKLESELNIKNKELSINLMAIFKKSEIKSDIINKLIIHEQNLKEEQTKREVSKIIKEIDNSYNEKIWNEFSTRFQEVHIGFYEKLLSKFPDLTQGELRLCAFLVLNMSSKEISEITGQQITTLENARYRLRKKLGITNSETNLVSFLSQI